MQWVLRAGLIGAALLIATGLIMALASGQHAAAAVHLSAIATEGSPAEHVIAGGLLALAVTPVLRVAALIGIWLHERDYRFALLGLIVLVVLLASAFSGTG